MATERSKRADRPQNGEHEPNPDPERLRRPGRAARPQADGADGPQEEYTGYQEVDRGTGGGEDQAARREADLQPGGGQPEK